MCVCVLNISISTDYFLLWLRTDDNKNVVYLSGDSTFTRHSSYANNFRFNLYRSSNSWQMNGLNFTWLWWRHVPKYRSFIIHFNALILSFLSFLFFSFHREIFLYFFVSLHFHLRLFPETATDFSMCIQVSRTSSRAQVSGILINVGFPDAVIYCSANGGVSSPGRWVG